MGFISLAWFVSILDSWCVRGGIFTYGLSAGLFNFIRTNGRLFSAESFRVVLDTMFLEIKVK